MAEAEAEQRKNQHHERRKLIVEGTQRTLGEKLVYVELLNVYYIFCCIYRVSKRVAPSIPHQQVSFAAIVRAQAIEEQQNK